MSYLSTGMQPLQFFFCIHFFMTETATAWLELPESGFRGFDAPAGVAQPLQVPGGMSKGLLRFYVTYNQEKCCSCSYPERTQKKFSAVSSRLNHQVQPSMKKIMINQKKHFSKESSSTKNRASCVGFFPLL